MATITPTAAADLQPGATISNGYRDFRVDEVLTRDGQTTLTTVHSGDHGDLVRQQVTMAARAEVWLTSRACPWLA